MIREIIQRTRAIELELKKSIGGKKVNNLPLNYKLATLYFDRRMLQAAEKQLIRCKELSMILVELEQTKRSKALAAFTTRECDSRCSSRRGSCIDPQYNYNEADLIAAQTKHQGILDDLSHVRELQSLFGTLTDQVKVLPCLRSRFTDDVAECECWWTEIRSSDKLIWYL